MRTTTNISITLPPTLLKEATRIAKKEGRTQSELFREALRQYVQDQEWRSLRAYGSAKSKALGLKASDVPRLVKEYRKEQQKAKK